MNFLYACDDHYAPYAGISITSLFENNKELDEVAVYVLVNGVSESNEQKFDELAKEYGRNIILIDAGEIDDYLNDNNLLPFGTAGREAYFRLFADRVLPEHVKRVIYFDCDIIVLGNLQELDNILFDDNTCCAMTCTYFFKHYYQYPKFKDGDKFYQSGVCVFDIERWKLLGAKRIIKLFEQGITYMRMHDMDILNLTVNLNTIKLPAEYNVMNNWHAKDVDSMFKLWNIDESTFYSKDAIRNAIKNMKILHFCGEKPWTVGSRVPRREQWEIYKAISPWRDIPKAEHKLGTVRKYEQKIGRLLPRIFHFKIIEAMHKFDVKRYYTKHNHFVKLEAYRKAVR